MGCYAISLLSAGMVYAIRRRADTPELRSLNMMFLGGGVFGIIDHAWNNELLSFSFEDIILGGALAVGIFAVWASVTYVPSILKKISPVGL